MMSQCAYTGFLELKVFPSIWLIKNINSYNLLAVMHLYNAMYHKAREKKQDTNKKESQSANRRIAPIIDAAFPLWTVTARH